MFLSRNELKKKADAPRPPLPRAEERRLLAAARAGDRRALRRVLELVARPALRFGRGFCRDLHDAEEIMQDVLTALARGIDRLRGDASLSTWAYTVARNACVRKRRRRAGAPERLASLEALDEVGREALAVPDPDADPIRSLERRRLSEALGGALAALPAAQREVLVLRDVEGLSARETGRVLGLSERAVKSRLHRARVALRTRLTPLLASETPGGSAAASASRGRRGCPDVVRLLSRHLEGELDASLCRRLERHVAGCDACRAECDQLRSVLGECRRFGRSAVPRELQQAVRDGIRKALATHAALSERPASGGR